MTIREYFNNMIENDYELDEIGELEQTVLHIMEEDPDDFTMWALENGIDPTAEEDGELVTTLWVWDVCGD